MRQHVEQNNVFIYGFGVVLALCCALFVFTQNWYIYHFAASVSIMISFVQAGVVFLLGYLIAAPIMNALRLKTHRSDVDVALAIVLGVGILSYAMLVFGFLGLYNKWFIFAVVSLVILLSVRKIIGSAKELINWLRTYEYDRLDGAWIAVIVIFGVLLVIYLCAAIGPSTSYDVLEYHLGTPQQYIRSGKLIEQPYNFYANMPFGIQMIYTLGVLIEGAKGYYTPKIINLGFLLLCLVLLNGITRELGCSGKYRAWSLILFLCMPVIFRSSLDAFADLGVTVYLASAILLWLVWVNTFRTRYMVFSSVFLGLVTTCKYPSIGIFIIPYLAILLPIGICYALKQKWGFLSTKSFGKHYGLKLLVACCVIGIFAFPWLLKNWIHTGNPVYPFLWNVFGGKWWTAERAAKVIALHDSVGFISVDHLRAFFGKLQQIGWLFIVPLVMVVCPGRMGRKKIVALWLYVLGGVWMWSTVSGSPDRFFAPGHLILAAIAGWTLNVFRDYRAVRFVPIVPYVLFVLFRMCVMTFQLNSDDLLSYGIESSFGMASKEEFLKDKLYGYYTAVDFINRNLPEEAKILFVYEARTFYVERDVIANTVHNLCPLYEFAKESADVTDLISKLRDEGIGYVLVNEIELERLEMMFGDYFPYDDYDEVKPVLDQFFETIKQSKAFTLPVPGRGEIYISKL